MVARARSAAIPVFRRRASATVGIPGITELESRFRSDDQADGVNATSTHIQAYGRVDNPTAASRADQRPANSYDARGSHSTGSPDRADSVAVKSAE